MWSRKTPPLNRYHPCRRPFDYFVPPTRPAYTCHKPAGTAEDSISHSRTEAVRWIRPSVPDWQAVMVNQAVSDAHCRALPVPRIVDLWSFLNNAAGDDVAVQRYLLHDSCHPARCRTLAPLDAPPPLFSC